jgi:hypothetical protein
MNAKASVVPAGDPAPPHPLPLPAFHMKSKDHRAKTPAGSIFGAPQFV